jgi:hypothetical protein
MLMNRHVCAALGALASALAGAHASAATRSMEDCRALADPSARLACYDELAGRTPAATQEDPPATAAPSFGTRSTPAPAPAILATPAPQAAKAPVEDLKHRPDFDSRLAAVVPLRHGYYRLELEDGTAYETTTVAPPPQAGEAVHIRRTFVGTTYLDTKGRSPIAIRLARRQ